MTFHLINKLLVLYLVALLTAGCSDIPSGEFPSEVSFQLRLKSAGNPSASFDLETLSEDMELSVEGPGDYSAYAYDSIMLSVEAMKNANSILPQDFIQELKNTSYEGLTGLIQFDSNGDRVDPQSTVFAIRDGAWVRYN